MGLPVTDVIQAPGNPFLDLSLPDPLPDGIEADVAAELLSRLKAQTSAIGRAPIAAELIERGIFPEETFYPQAKAAPKKRASADEQPAAPALPGAGLSPPDHKNLEAENVLIRCLFEPTEWRGELLDGLSPEEFFGAPQRKVARLLYERIAAAKSIDPVVIKDCLSRDGSACDLSALGLVDFALSKTVPTKEVALELASNVRVRHVERLENESLRELEKIAKGGLRNGALVAKIGDLLDSLTERRHAIETDVAPMPWPARVADDALYGIAGEIVRTIEPTTVADPSAVLMQLLTALGNIMGRSPCWYKDATRHSLALYTAVIGPTALGAKGTGLDFVKQVVSGVDSTWSFKTGLVSGEGLLHFIRDASQSIGPNGVGIMDTGADDKRACFEETEFSSVLTARTRQGNILTENLRKAWDGALLGSATRRSPTFSTDHHVSLVAHMTLEEFGGKFRETDKKNGFGNRIVFALSRESKEESETKPRRIDWETNGIRPALRDALNWVKEEGEELVLVRDEEGEHLWSTVSPRLKAQGCGPHGKMLARARPQVMRMAAIYAVLDRSAFIRAPHLRAALAAWDYCCRSVAFIFGASADLGEDEQKALKALATSASGITLRELARVAFRCDTHRASDTLKTLIRTGLVREQAEKTLGRPRIAYRAVFGDPND